MIDLPLNRHPVRNLWPDRSDPLGSIKLQYFIAYAVMGSLTPLLSVLLKQRGLQESQIGYALGASNLAIFLTPVLMTLLADSHFDSRRLIAIVFAISSLSLIVLYFVTGFWLTLLLLCLHSLAYVAMNPLQDGLNFSVQKQRKQMGQQAMPYHKIRVWGTVGFIVPSLLMFSFLGQGGATSVILLIGTGFCLLGLLNSYRLPDPRVQELQADEPVTSNSRLPTAEAARALLRPQVLVFCLSMALAGISSSAYYGFYPLYLTEVVGVEKQWVGLIFNVGVVFEIGYMLAFGWLLKTLGFKRFMALGMLGMALRMTLLATCPYALVAIGAQLLHGFIVTSTMVAPAMYLNHQAGDKYRSSIQGLYTMAVAGSSRILGSLISGYVAQSSLLHLFGYAAVLAFLAASLFIFAFRDDFPVEPHTHL